MTKYSKKALDAADDAVALGISHYHTDRWVATAVFDTLERAPGWEEVGSDYGVDFGEPFREECAGRAWERTNKDPYRPIGSSPHQGSSFRYFRDTRWQPPLAVGDVIETVEDLERLPLKAVFIDCDNDAWQKAGLIQFLCVTSDGFYTAESALKSGPFTVVHLPKPEATK